MQQEVAIYVIAKKELKEKAYKFYTIDNKNIKVKYKNIVHRYKKTETMKLFDNVYLVLRTISAN